MEAFLLYIVKSGICLSIFLIVYIIFLRPTTFYRFNRIFLVSGFIMSFIIPAVRYTYDVFVPAVMTVERTISETAYTVKSQSPDIWTILFIVYLTGFFIVSGRNVMAYRKLRLLVKNGTHAKKDNINIIGSNHIKSPFSVLNYVLLNSQSLSKTEKELILQHEIMHINQRHWLDLLCSECILLIQWFNPLSWFYVHLLKENHEFLADKAVIESGVSPAIYQAVLINQRFQGQVFSFTSSFNDHKPINRLNMLRKEKSSPWKRISALTIVPVFGVFIWLSAVPNYIVQPIENTMIQIKKEGNPDKPEILVLRAKDSIKVELKEKVTFTNAEELQPLYIIDGIKSQDGIKDLSPDEIESISVLKDKTATDHFGNDARGGAILITTKKKRNTHISDSLVVTNNNLENKKGTISILPSTKKSEKSNNLPDQLLILIDGKESSKKDMDSLDPNNIESVEVLKNKDTASAYGNKDVIKITLKK